MFRICPGPGAASAGTISSPVTRTAARARRATRTRARPAAARRTRSAGESLRPAARRDVPAAITSPRRRT